MGAFAEFERSLILERQKEGIALAKARGVYKGRKVKLCESDLNELLIRAKCGENKIQLAKDFGITRQSIYRLIAKHPDITEPSLLEEVGVSPLRYRL